MKDHLGEIVARQPGMHLKRYAAAEYLQARILQVLQESGAFESWAFLGGTALRFLYGLPRYSEDLDFSVVAPGASTAAAFRRALERIKSALAAENYALRIRVNDRKTVWAAFVRFDGLLFDLGLSPHRSEALSIKIEVDADPPAGARYETTLIRRHVVLNLVHLDRASLFAGKIHATLTRAYAKGRDLFDLIWYLSDKSWPGPNIALLNAALSQTGWPGERAAAGSWRRILRDKVESLDWKKAREDVRPFLERENDIEIVTRENCLKLLERR